MVSKIAASSTKVWLHTVSTVLHLWLMHSVAYYFSLAVGYLSAQKLWHWEDVRKTELPSVYASRWRHQGERTCTRVAPIVLWEGCFNSGKAQRWRKRLWHFYNEYICPVGSGWVALSSLSMDLKIRTRIVFRARENPSVSLLLVLHSPGIWTGTWSAFLTSNLPSLLLRKEGAGASFRH